MSLLFIRLGYRSVLLLLGFTLLVTLPQERTHFNDAQAGKPFAKGSPEEIATHFDECWNSGDHGMPTHVIYRNGTGWAVGGRAKVDEALNDLFGDIESDIDVSMFCIR